MKQKIFFIIFKGLSMNQITQVLLQVESPTLTEYCIKAVLHGTICMIRFV